MSPDEIRAAAETYRELGTAYHDAVIESFMDKVSREIDARVDARLAREQCAHEQAAQPPVRHQRGSSTCSTILAVISLVLGIPISAIAVAAGRHPAGAVGLIVVWLGIAAVNIAYNGGFRAWPRQRAERR